MKKLLAVLGLFLIGLSSLALNVDDNLNANVNTNAYNALKPMWSQVCPFGYENVEFDNSFYWIRNNRRIRDQKNYWAERRYDFEKMVNSCYEVPVDARDACYVRIKQREDNINSAYNQYQAERAAYRRGLMLQQPLIYGNRYNYYP